jgi:hypothetical protein
MPERSNPSEATIAADEEEAKSAHGADRGPTEDEEQAADRSRKDPNLSGDQKDVAAHYEEMADKGVSEKGEGQIS